MGVCLDAKCFRSRRGAPCDLPDHHVWNGWSRDGKRSARAYAIARCICSHLQRQQQNPPFAGWSICLFSGGRVSAIFSTHLLREFEAAANVTSDNEAKTILEKCSRPAIQEWRDYQAAGPDAESVIVMACGKTRTIFRCTALPTPEARKMEGGLCITGQTGNWAAFLPNRFYRYFRSSSVDELACLASCSILMASQFDPLAVETRFGARHPTAKQRLC
jgi:hypothetical protein